MRQVLLILLLLLGASALKAQIRYPSLHKDSIPRSAGDELILAQKQFYMGLVFVGVGATITALSFTGEEPNGTIAVVGTVPALIGSVIILRSFRHLGHAGILLNKGQVSDNRLYLTPGAQGIGFTYKF